ncbi:MAG: DUF4375 domain-containing protein [Desulfobacteraceae bacterium]|nr:MAG: DUF4375 domain-containing protein [Desulfobacteraceae bacterium]
MTADEIIQDLSIKIYSGPLSVVRHEPDYPDLENPLHLIVLLIDCDTEVQMQGMIGFLENNTGAHLGATIHALRLFGALKVSESLEKVQQCMRRHDVTWERLRGDFEGMTEFQITSFHELHGETLDAFAQEVCDIAGGFELFNHESGEPVYDLLCAHLDLRIIRLREEIQKREAK